jgi:fucose permease
VTVTVAVEPERTAAAVEVRRAVAASYGAFIAAGLAFTWVSRLPQIKHSLNLSPSVLGLVLLSLAGGSMVALPLSGPIIHRFGPRRVVSWAAAQLCVALILIGVGYLHGVGFVVAGLLIMGAAVGAWDVSMNVHGALAERRLGRSIMPRFHAGYSLGTVAGALAGAALIALGVPVTAHLIAIGVAVLICVPWIARGFLPETNGPAARVAGPATADSEGSPRRGPVFQAWREPRTLLVGLFVLAFAFAEGAGNDWIAVSATDNRHTSGEVATLGLAVFLAAMTTGRWFGPAVLDRWGRVVVVRLLAGLGIIGVLLFAFGPGVGGAFAGSALWGIGVCLGFPIGMSAGSDDPNHAAVRVSVISSIGYCAFLGGPPLIGLLGDHITVQHALAVVAVLLVISVAVSSAVRPLPQTGADGPDEPASTQLPGPVRPAALPD